MASTPKHRRPTRRKNPHRSRSHAKAETEEEEVDIALTEEDLELVRSSFKSADTKQVGRLSFQQLEGAIRQLMIAGAQVTTKQELVFSVTPSKKEDAEAKAQEEAEAEAQAERQRISRSKKLEMDVQAALRHRDLKALLTAPPAEVENRVDIRGVHHAQGVTGELVEADFYYLIGRQVSAKLICAFSYTHILLLLVGLAEEGYADWLPCGKVFAHAPTGTQVTQMKQSPADL